jgi:hypothetical protein
MRSHRVSAAKFFHFSATHWSPITGHCSIPPVYLLPVYLFLTSARPTGHRLLVTGHSHPSTFHKFFHTTAPHWSPITGHCSLPPVYLSPVHLSQNSFYPPRPTGLRLLVTGHSHPSTIYLLPLTSYHPPLPSPPAAHASLHAR